jgi:hypothetical protein
MKLLCTGGPLERILGFRVHSCLRFRMALTVTLFFVADEFTNTEYLSLLLATIEITYATFRVLLEGEGLMDYPFNAVRGEVYVIPRVDAAIETSSRTWKVMENKRFLHVLCKKKGSYF